MKIIGELKKKVDNAKSIEEVKEILKEAGLELTDEELKQVELSDDDLDGVNGGGVSAFPCRHVFL